ncbi:MAG: hypothetical protein WEC17_01835 [Candidatus Saccharimonadales bacterium]
MSELPNEIFPSSEELDFLYPGLQEMRFRRDGRLAVGLFLREKDHKPVVAISDIESDVYPFIFSVKPEVANQAYEHPYPYAPKAGKLIIQDVFESPDIRAV